MSRKCAKNTTGWDRSLGTSKVSQGIKTPRAPQHDPRWRKRIVRDTEPGYSFLGHMIAILGGFSAFMRKPRNFSDFSGKKKKNEQYRSGGKILGPQRQRGRA